jgi:hypothetical protein
MVLNILELVPFGRWEMIERKVLLPLWAVVMRCVTMTAIKVGYLGRLRPKQVDDMGPRCLRRLQLPTKAVV